MQEFNDTYEMLAEMETLEELKYWAEEKKHSNLLNSADSSIINFSDPIKTILIEGYEYELGDSIIWYNKGNLYGFSKADEPNLKSLKKEIAKCKKVGGINSSPANESNFKNVTIMDDNGWFQ